MSGVLGVLASKLAGKHWSDFSYLGEDRLAPAAASLLGDGAARAVDYLLTSGETRFVYRFLLDDAGRVLGFDVEQR